MSKLNFTNSKDGQKRATVRVEFRFTEQEIENIKKAARTDNMNDWRKWLQNFASSHTEDGISERLGWCKE